jgi:CubicO group peptidase (beta-lactamase class C family)
MASARKTLLALLYGKYVQQGTIRLVKTLREMGIEDVGGLSDQELLATIEDVISAKSGVYHPAANEGDATASAPSRNSQRPGACFLHNNRDFNVAGAIFEKQTGKDIYSALEEDLARPTGMEDFRPATAAQDGRSEQVPVPCLSLCPVDMDMARLGQLMLQGGKWNGVQVVPAEWIRRMTSLVTPMNELEPVQNRALGTGERWGYGYMTWVWDAPQSQGPLVGAFQASGFGGQFITVIPSLKMVVAHKVDTFDDSPLRAGKRFLQGEYIATLQMLINSRQ